jgi:hypothetical protein
MPCWHSRAKGTENQRCDSRNSRVGWRFPGFGDLLSKHPATFPSLPTVDYFPEKNFVSNGACPAYLAYVAKRAGVRRFVYASSCFVYAYTENAPKPCKRRNDPAKKYVACRSSGAGWPRPMVALSLASRPRGMARSAAPIRRPISVYGPPTRRASERAREAADAWPPNARRDRSCAARCSPSGARGAPKGTGSDRRRPRRSGRPPSTCLRASRRRCDARSANQGSALSSQRRLTSAFLPPLGAPWRL